MKPWCLIIISCILLPHSFANLIKLTCLCWSYFNRSVWAPLIQPCLQLLSVFTQHVPQPCVWRLPLLICFFLCHCEFCCFCLCNFEVFSFSLLFLLPHHPIFFVVVARLMTPFAFWVSGNPAMRQGKPGSGVGLGYGLRFKSPAGHFQVDYAINSFQQKTVYFGISNLIWWIP